jgi:hypothetical protein
MAATTVNLTESYLADFPRLLRQSSGDNQLFDAIVNAWFRSPNHPISLGLGFVTFLLYNKKTGCIDRIKKTENELGNLGSEISVKPFKAIKIPLDDKVNIIARAIRSGKWAQTNDWDEILTPGLSAQESRLNQANSGIASSVVYPLKARDGGALIFHYFITLDKITKELHDFMSSYTKIVDNTLNNKNKL